MFFFAFVFSVSVFSRWCVAAGITVDHHGNHIQEKWFVIKTQQEEVQLPYVRLVFLRSVLFVRADVIHQVSFLVLLLIAVLCVFQEVERLQIVIWNPAQSKHFNPSCSVYQVTVRWGEDGWLVPSILVEMCVCTSWDLCSAPFHWSGAASSYSPSIRSAQNPTGRAESEPSECEHPKWCLCIPLLEGTWMQHMTSQWILSWTRVATND